MLDFRDLENFGIKIRDENSSFWVVRASGGLFIPNFIHGGVAAIGHLDGFTNRPQDPKKITENDLRIFLTNKTRVNPNENSKPRIGNVKTQIERFIHDIHSGDTIVSLDTNMVAVGVAKGEAFFDTTPITTFHADSPPTTLRYATRIPVEWEQTFRRAELPLAVRNTLQAHQTVFSINKYWSYIYHLIYPIFADHQDIYYSNFIHQKRDVRADAMAKLMGFFSDIEPILFGNTPKQKDAFNNLNFELLSKIFEAEKSEHFASFKTEVFSEGPIWWKMPLKYIEDYRRTVVLVLIVVLLFGGELGPLKVPGIITPEMREHLLQFITKKIEEHDLQKAKEELKLDIPRKFSNPRITTSALTYIDDQTEG